MAKMATLSIGSFNKDGFSITTIHSSKTDKIMFLAKQVLDYFNYSNLSATISKLPNDDKLMVESNEYPKFIDILCENNLISKKTRRVTLITEAGLYKLILGSQKSEAKSFLNWVTGEVLPSIRKNGQYSISSISSSEISKQTLPHIQLKNSKEINSKNIQSGLYDMINYNKKNCKQVTGMTPSEIKNLYRKKNKSAKQILREQSPELAATMSLNDHIVLNHNVKLESLKNIDEAAIALFKEIINLGFVITE